MTDGLLIHQDRSRLSYEATKIDLRSFPVTMVESLDPGTSRLILRAAMCAVREAVTGIPRTEAEEVPELAVSGLFVTIRIADALRGCIGFVELQDDFAATLREAAQRAATKDYRFADIAPEELAELSVDVTLLGPLQKLSDPLDFTIGTHGLVLEYLGRRGLLLPQVATDRGWDRAQFLQGLCQKAHVDENAWNAAEAVLYRFTGVVLSQKTDDPPIADRRSD